MEIEQIIVAAVTLLIFVTLFLSKETENKKEKKPKTEQKSTW